MCVGRSVEIDNDRRHPPSSSRKILFITGPPQPGIKGGRALLDTLARVRRSSHCRRLVGWSGSGELGLVFCGKKWPSERSAEQLAGGRLGV